MELSSTAAVIKHAKRSRLSLPWLSRPNFVLFFADSAALLISALFFLLILLPEAGGMTWLRYSGAILVAWLAFTSYGFGSKFYDWRHYGDQVATTGRAFGGVLVAFGTLLLIGFMFKWTEDFSRLWISSWFTAFFVYVLISRIVLTWHLAAAPENRVHHRRAIILGAGEHGQAVHERLRSGKGHGIDIVGFVDDRSTRLSPNKTKTPILGGTANLKRLICEDGVDLVIIALPWTAYDRITQLLRKLSDWSVDIYMAPDRVGLIFADRPVYRIGGIHVLSLKEQPISDWNALIKRAEDLAIAIPAVILLSPLLLLTALAIRLESKGSPIFVQKRYGFNSNLIDVYKFRSMYVEQTDINAEKLTERDDPRVTRVGRFIRRTSIDELPQLFNVILGTMSVVGPRPHATQAKAGDRLYQEAVDLYASRHRVKPGITGWAQCNGWRGETDSEEKIVKRVEHDLYYIDNWSLFLDLLTIYKTLRLLVVKEENAY